MLCCHFAGEKKHNTFSGYYFSCTEHKTGLVWRLFWAPWVLSGISYPYFINLSVCWSNLILRISPLLCWVLCVWNAFPLRSNGAAFFVYAKRETGIYQLFKCMFFHFHFIVLVSSILLQARGEPADHCLGPWAGIRWLIMSLYTLTVAWNPPEYPDCHETLSVDP